MADYYKRLSIDRDASRADIKKAYRKEAMRLHPDRGGSHTGMRKLNKMYQTLTDPKKRKRYNQTLDGKRVKVVTINKPPRSGASTPWRGGAASGDVWGENIHAGGPRGKKRTTTPPRSDRVKEQDLKVLWGRKGSPSAAAAGSTGSHGRGANTGILRKAQELLTELKKKKPSMGRDVDIAYMQLGQIIKLLKRRGQNEIGI